MLATKKSDPYNNLVEYIFAYSPIKTVKILHDKGLEYNTMVTQFQKSSRNKVKIE